MRFASMILVLLNHLGLAARRSPAIRSVLNRMDMATLMNAPQDYSGFNAWSASHLPSITRAPEFAAANGNLCGASRTA